MVVGQGRGELDVVNVVPQLREQLACHFDHVVSEGEYEDLHQNSRQLRAIETSTPEWEISHLENYKRDLRRWHGSCH